MFFIFILQIALGAIFTFGIGAGFLFLPYCLIATTVFMTIVEDSLFIRSRKNPKTVFNVIVVVVCILFIIFTIFVIQYMGREKMSNLFILILTFFGGFYMFHGNIKGYFERKRNKAKTKLGQIYYKNIFSAIVVLACMLFIIFTISFVKEIERNKDDDCDKEYLKSFRGDYFPKRFSEYCERYLQLKRDGG